MNPDETQQPAEQKSPLKSLRTYQGDMQQAIAEKNLGMTSIAAAEQNRRDRQGPLPANPEAKNKFFVAGGIALIIIGIVSVSLVYIFRQNSSAPVAVTLQKSLIPFSSKQQIIFDPNAPKSGLIQAIAAAGKSFNAPVNSVLYLALADQNGMTPNISDVLGLLTPNIPGSLERSLGAPYMFGIYSASPNAPFIVLSTTDYGQSFAGMLSWEKIMPFDLAGVFGQFNSTSTPVWSDESLQNKDLRVLKDAEGNTLLLYSFLDKNTILITGNENTFTALLGKYIIGQTQK